MTTLLLLAHCSPEFADRFAAPGVEVRAFVAPPLPGVPGGGLSSRYAALAARLSATPGGLLPALVRYVGAGSVEGWSRIVLASWSAGFKLAEALFAPLASGSPLAPPLVGWIALDSGYSALDADGTASDVQLAGFTALARLAREGRALLWFGHTDLPVTAYADTGDVARELVRLAGPPEGLFRVERWPTDGRPWGEQHSAALLERGPVFVAAALAALDGGAVDAPASTPRTGEVPMLRQGSAGPTIRALQRALNEAGAVPPLAEDGAFGPRTFVAVVGFQLARGLVTDGLVGPLTWAALLAPEGEATPAPVESVGLVALKRLQAEIGVRETPGPGTTARVVEYGSGAVRGGKRLDLGPSDEPPWCAALQGWAERGLAGALPWRWAVAEVWRDGEAAGLTRPPHYRARAGDLAVFRRAGGDPRRGGPGHVARVERGVEEGGGYTTIGGNEGDAVRRTARNVADPELVGWVVRSDG